MNFLKLHRTLFEISDSQPQRKNLLSYLAHSSSPNFQFEQCFQYLLDRKGSSQDVPPFGYMSHESKIFISRYELISNNNLAYCIATKDNPTVKDLEEFSYIKPSWSFLYPILIYLIHNPHMIEDYNGFLPFGKNVIKYMKKCGEKISNNPGYKDHVILRNVTTKLTALTGLNKVSINVLMYLEGQDE